MQVPVSAALRVSVLIVVGVIVGVFVMVKLIVGVLIVGVLVMARLLLGVLIVVVLIVGSLIMARLLVGVLIVVVLIVGVLVRVARIVVVLVVLLLDVNATGSGSDRAQVRQRPRIAAYRRLVSASSRASRAGWRKVATGPTTDRKSNIPTEMGSAGTGPTGVCVWAGGWGVGVGG